MLISNKEIYAPNNKTENFHIHQLITHLAGISWIALERSQELLKNTYVNTKNIIFKGMLFATCISK